MKTSYLHHTQKRSRWLVLSALLSMGVLSCASLRGADSVGSAASSFTPISAQHATYSVPVTNQPQRALTLPVTHAGAVDAVSISGDGHWITTVGPEQTVHIWNNQGILCMTLTHAGYLAGKIVLSPDLRHVVLGTREETTGYYKPTRIVALPPVPQHGPAVTVDVRTVEDSWELDKKEYGERVAFSKEGHRIVTTGPQNLVEVWSVATHKKLLSFSCDESCSASAEFSPDGKRIVTAGWKVAELWDAETGASVRLLQGHTNLVHSAVFSPDGSRIVTAGEDATARLWNAKTGGMLHILKGHKGGVHTAAFSPDGKQIVTASHDRTARVWDANTASLLSSLEHTSLVTDAVFLTDGKQLITSSNEGMVRLWTVDASNPQVLIDGSLQRPAHVLAANSVSMTRPWVVTGGAEGAVRIWDPQGLLHITVQGLGAPVWRAELSFDERYLAVTLLHAPAVVIPLPLIPRSDRAVVVETNTVDVWVLGQDASGVWFSPDGKRVLVAKRTAAAEIWSMESRQKLVTLAGPAGSLQIAAFSDDATRIVTANADNGVQTWDAATGALLRTLTGDLDSVWTAVFSPDGTRVLTAGTDKTTRMWDAQTGACLYKLVDQQDIVWSAVFSPDGQYIATASKDGTARLYEAKTGRPLHIWASWMGTSILSVLLTRDGVYTAHENGQVLVWSLDARNHPVH